MQVNDTDLADGGYEQRYSVMLANTPLHFVRRPVSIAPPDNTVCFVDNGPRLGTIPKHTAAHFKNGKWHRVRFEPTHWTHWDERVDRNVR